MAEELIEDQAYEEYTRAVRRLMEAAQDTGQTLHYLDHDTAIHWQNCLREICATLVAALAAL